jgi:hypothetical protein
VWVALLLPSGGANASWQPAPDEFVGTTPCDAHARRFVGIAANTPCERITWQLTLSVAPSTYTMTAAFGMQVVAGPGLVNGGTTARLRGSWSTRRGSQTDPDAVVYRLTDESSGQSVAFVKVGNNLLHFLNDDQGLAVGNAGWSYTLSRTAVRRNDVTSHWVADTPAGRKVAGVFEGRTPCQEVARALGASPADDCVKLKWRLTLLQDPASGAPTTYKLEGTLYRSRPLTGTWTMLKDAGADRVVYRLELEKPATFLSFVHADDNILFFVDASGRYLVGNDAFSYTLNRSADTRVADGFVVTGSSRAPIQIGSVK